MRDRVLPLGVRRPIQITHDHFDFSSNSIVEEDIGGETDPWRVYDTETQRHLTQIFIAQCEFAVHLTDLLTTLYPLDGASPVSPNSVDELTVIQDRIRKHKATLSAWFAKSAVCTAQNTNSSHASIILFTNLLLMYYQ